MSYFARNFFDGNYFAPSYFPGATTPMATIQDFFDTAASDDTTVVADTAAVVAAQKTLDAATSLDVSDHAALAAAVVAQGPTLVTLKLGDGTEEYVALLPQPDGTIRNVVLFDGTMTPPAP